MVYKKDSQFFGVTIGLLLPIAVYLLWILIAFIIKSFWEIDTISLNEKMQLASIISNLFTLRYYFVKLRFDLTGRGILLVTFIYVLVYFWFHNS